MSTVPSKLTPEQLVKLLTSGGTKKASMDGIQSHIERGAPVNPDGTLHLIHYVAWLASEVQ